MAWEKKASERGRQPKGSMEVRRWGNQFRSWREDRDQRRRAEQKKAR